MHLFYVYRYGKAQTINNTQKEFTYEINRTTWQILFFLVISSEIDQQVSYHLLVLVE